MSTATELNRCRTISVTTIVGLVVSLLIVALTLAMLWTGRTLYVFPTLMIAFLVFFPLHDQNVLAAITATMLPNIPIAVVYAMSVLICAVALHMLYYINFYDRPGARIGTTVALGAFAASIIALTLLKYLYSTDSAREDRRCDMLINAANEIRNAPAVKVV